jgi:RNA polymerase sigma factor (TIGR02999 family)
LQSIEHGEVQSLERLLPLVYDELRHMAAARMSREAAGHTLQPTALVHEAWLRLMGDGVPSSKGRAYFFAAAAEAMRRILVEHARRKSRLKHGGGQERLDIQDVELADAAPDDKILLIHEALSELEKEQPERAKVVVLKYFGGMTNKDLAETLGTSERSVNRQWLCARQWLFQKIHTQL